jgi:hypothetical protein
MVVHVSSSQQVVWVFAYDKHLCMLITLLHFFFCVFNFIVILGRDVLDTYRMLRDAKVADPLLERSFVASMNLGEALQLFCNAVVPTEIMLATLFYHLHTNKKSDDWWRVSVCIWCHYQ